MAELARPLEGIADIIAEVGWCVFQGDCVAILRELPDECIDLLITDPAYESNEKHRTRVNAAGERVRYGTTTRLQGPWFPTFPDARLPELLVELYRVLKRDAHAYIFSNQESARVITPLAEQAGFKWWKDLTWIKTSEAGTVRIGMGYHWRNCTERIIFLEKGKRKLNYLGWPEVMFGPSGDGPAEKPPEVLSRLVENSSIPGELVLDPFAGSGSTGEAALKLGRRALLLDLDVTRAQARLESFPRV
jgi:site-specific DNA-methyltransferase (adenine-specific)